MNDCFLVSFFKIYSGGILDGNFREEEIMPKEFRENKVKENMALRIGLSVSKRLCKNMDEFSHSLGEVIKYCEDEEISIKEFKEKFLTPEEIKGLVNIWGALYNGFFTFDYTKRKSK